MSSQPTDAPLTPAELDHPAMASLIVILLLFLSLIILSHSSPSDVQYFNHYMQRFGHKYQAGTREYDYRLKIFQVRYTVWTGRRDSCFVVLQQSLSRVRRKVRTSASNDAFYGITEFSAMTPDEFRKTRLKSAFKGKKEKRLESKRLLAAVPVPSLDLELPLRVDWRERGIIAQVRNQGKCGACWAHSTVQTIESVTALEHGSAVTPLSVQQVIDCASSPSSPNHGCDGGDTCAALQWMLKSQVKLVPEAEYPTRDDSGQCRQSLSPGVQVANFTCEE